MTRDFELISLILQIVADNQADERPTVFRTKGTLEDYAPNRIADTALTLADNGFLRKIAEQADFKGLEYFHITWKGLCLLGLLDLAVSSDEPLVRANAIVAYTAMQ